MLTSLFSRNDRPASRRSWPQVEAFEGRLLLSLSHTVAPTVAAVKAGHIEPFIWVAPPTTGRHHGGDLDSPSEGFPHGEGTFSQ
jgi:hypothetical protein